MAKYEAPRAAPLLGAPDAEPAVASFILGPVAVVVAGVGAGVVAGAGVGAGVVAGAVYLAAVYAEVELWP